jgi:hypothetical protein
MAVDPVTIGREKAIEKEEEIDEIIKVDDDVEEGKTIVWKKDITAVSVVLSSHHRIVLGSINLKNCAS